MIVAPSVQSGLSALPFSRPHFEFEEFPKFWKHARVQIHHLKTITFRMNQMKKIVYSSLPFAQVSRSDITSLMTQLKTQLPRQKIPCFNFSAYSMNNHICVTGTVPSSTATLVPFKASVTLSFLSPFHLTGPSNLNSCEIMCRVFKTTQSYRIHESEQKTLKTFFENIIIFYNLLNFYVMEFQFQKNLFAFEFNGSAC